MVAMDGIVLLLCSLDNFNKPFYPIVYAEMGTDASPIVVLKGASRGRGRGGRCPMIGNKRFAP